MFLNFYQFFNQQVFTNLSTNRFLPIIQPTRFYQFFNQQVFTNLSTNRILPIIQPTRFYQLFNQHVFTNDSIIMFYQSLNHQFMNLSFTIFCHDHNGMVHTQKPQKSIYLNISIILPTSLLWLIQHYKFTLY